VKTDADADTLRASLTGRYAQEPFVHVMPEGQWPHTKWTAGTNHCFLAVGKDRLSGRGVVVGVIDNMARACRVR